MKIVIQTKDLTKKYKNATALNNFNITINEGDIYGIIGANGAGKSTFKKLITGLTSPTSGEIKLFETDDLEKSRTQIGSIIETPSFFKNLTAYENLLYYCKQFGCEETIISDCLDKVKLSKVAKTKKFREFSLGMKQRLGIALALMNNPRLVILDEPTNGLDPVGISELRDIIKTLNEDGVTFVICSHILSELSQIATKFVIISDGNFIKEFTKEELAKMSSDRVVISSPEFDKLKSYLVSKNLKFAEIDANTVEVESQDLRAHCFAKDMVEKEIIIDAIYHKKITLEDIFLTILDKNGGNKNV